MADKDKTYQFEVTLKKVPEFGELRIIYSAKYEEGQNKAHKLPEIFSGNTELFTTHCIPYINF